MPPPRVSFAPDAPSSQPQPVRQCGSADDGGVLHVSFGLLKVGGLYRTAARLQGAAAIAVPPADPALQLTAERRDGGTAIVAVLRAAATGPFSADARLFVADSAEQVAVRVSANVMPASKGTPALRPDVFVVAEEGGAADTDLDA